MSLTHELEGGQAKAGTLREARRQRIGGYVRTGKRTVIECTQVMDIRSQVSFAMLCTLSARALVMCNGSEIRKLMGR